MRAQLSVPVKAMVPSITMMAEAVHRVAQVMMITVPVPVLDQDMQHVIVMNVAVMEVSVTMAPSVTMTPPVASVRIGMEP